MFFSVRDDRKLTQGLGSLGRGLIPAVVRGAITASFFSFLVLPGVAPASAANQTNSPPLISVNDHNLTSGTVIPAMKIFEAPDVQGPSQTLASQPTASGLTETGSAIGGVIGAVVGSVQAVRVIEIADPVGGGVFELDGAQYDGVTFTVPETSFASLTYIAGAPGSEAISARISDGFVWSEAAVVTIVTSAGVEGVVVDLIKGEVFLPSQGWMAANSFFEFYYANSDVFSDVGYAQPLDALREFVH